MISSADHLYSDWQRNRQTVTFWARPATKSSHNDLSRSALRAANDHRSLPTSLAGASYSPSESPAFLAPVGEPPSLERILNESDRQVTELSTASVTVFVPVLPN
jgi:hypothetical protein